MSKNEQKQTSKKKKIGEKRKMKKLENIKTKNDILELQKNETINVELTKRQARIIGFALDTEYREFEKLIKELQARKTNEDLTEEQTQFINENIKDFNNLELELIYLEENLKKFYGFLN